MKNLILQTYIKDNHDRPHINTYVSRPKLERTSKRQFEQYAKLIGADYEYLTEPTQAWYETYSGAHWLRMEMFDRLEYDNVLYVDCDVLIEPSAMARKDNIFDYPGIGSTRLHPGSHAKLNRADPKSRDWTDIGVNCGVLKFTREECEIMREYIHDPFYYNVHPGHNQEAINMCYRDHVGELTTSLPYKFNVTHWDCKDTVFRHYAGHWKDPKTLKKDKLYKRVAR